jgi:hypothetical protein
VKKAGVIRAEVWPKALACFFFGTKIAPILAWNDLPKMA